MRGDPDWPPATVGQSVRRASLPVGVRAFQSGATDSHGNPVKSWAAPVERLVYGFSPGGSVEPGLPNQDRVVTTPTLYAPYDFPVSEHDLVVVGGDEYEVVGRPARWRHPSGDKPGCVVNLKLVEG